MSGQVRGHHLFDHFAERVTRFPTEHSTRFRRIANQQVNLRRPVIPLINFHELTIVETDFRKRELAQLANTISLAGSNHDIIRFREFFAWPQSRLASRFPILNSDASPAFMRATVLVILRVTNSNPRRGLSWLNIIPLTQ